MSWIVNKFIRKSVSFVILRAFRWEGRKEVRKGRRNDMKMYFTSLKGKNQQNNHCCIHPNIPSTEMLLKKDIEKSFFTFSIEPRTTDKFEDTFPASVSALVDSRYSTLTHIFEQQKHRCTWVITLVSCHHLVYYNIPRTNCCKALKHCLQFLITLLNIPLLLTSEQLFSIKW